MDEVEVRVSGLGTRRPLMRAHIKKMLIRDLALSGMTQAQLGEKYDVTQQGISDFAKRHQQAILAVVDDAANEYSSLWISKKINRLAELESMAESLLEIADGNEMTTSIASEVRQILRSAAEELGDIPNKQGVSVNVLSTVYEISNVDLEDLR